MDRTLCEINCQLVTADGSGRCPACPDAQLASSGAEAPELEGHQTIVHAKCPTGQWPSGYCAEEGTWQGGSVQSLLTRLAAPALAGQVRGWLKDALGLRGPPPRGRPLAWHPSQLRLAAAEGDAVLLFDYSSHVPLLGQASTTDGGPPPPLDPTRALRHELQSGVASAAWRPNAGASLAVGCSQGVCLWTLGRGVVVGRGDAAGWVTWLQSAGEGGVTSLAWHPGGHLLAGAAQGSPGFMVWDAATGVCTPLRAGLEMVSLLRWSPGGEYLLAGHADGSFRLWDTQAWGSAKWAAGGGGSASAGSGAGRLVDAAWSPDGRSLVLGYEGAASLAALHLTGDPPSMAAQLLPVALPELGAGRGEARGRQQGGAGALLQALAWDRRGQRLAVAVGGGHPGAGCIALYDTRCDPIMSARCIGFMRAGQAGGGDEAAAPGGGGDVQLAFHPSFAQGALLAVGGGDRVAVLPLFFPPSSS